MINYRTIKNVYLIVKKNVYHIKENLKKSVFLLLSA
jgi:hypothetical protein